MATFASEASTHHLSTVELVKVTVGSTTYRWSMHRTVDLAGEGEFEARVLKMTPIDREIADGLKAADCSVWLSNQDGALDNLVTQFSDANENGYRAEAVFYRGTTGATALSEFRQVAKLQWAELGAARDDGAIEIYFFTQVHKLFGNIEPPTVQEVCDALATDQSATFSGVTPAPGKEDDRVPIAMGIFQTVGYDGWDAGGDANKERGADGVTAQRNAFVADEGWRLVAVSPTPFDVSTDARKTLITAYDQVPRQDGKGGGPGGAVGIETAHLASYDATTTGGWYVLAYNGTIPGPISFPVYTQVSGSAVNPHPVDAMNNVIDAFASRGANRWSSTYVDTTSFSNAKSELDGAECRVLIKQSTPALSWISEVAKAFSFDLYVSRESKLSASLIEPFGEGEAQTADLEITEQEHILGVSAKLPRPGDRNGILNIVNASLFKPYHTSDPKVVEVRLQESIDDHDIEQEIDIDSRLYPNEGVLRSINQWRLHRVRNPRMEVRVLLPLIGASVELGDIVKFTHALIPGFSAGQFCRVEGIRDDFTAQTVELLITNWDAVYTSSVYIIPQESDWIWHTAGAGDDIGLVASSSTADYSTFFTKSGIDPTAEDFLSVRAWPGATASNANDGWYRITAVNTGTKEITISPAAAANETIGNGAWRIYRGQTNRSTSNASYTAQADKYGIPCGASGTFDHDGGAGYVYGF